MSHGIFVDVFDCEIGEHVKKVSHAVSGISVKDLFLPTITCGIGSLFARKFKK